MTDTRMPLASRFYLAWRDADCGALLVYQEGCLVCRSCGYNKCG